MPRIALVGYGNPLRSDDVAGRRVVEGVAERWPDTAMALTGVQLVPEWAADLAEVDVAVFVDASCANRRKVCLRSLAPATAVGLMDGHTFGPQQLLSLSATVYGRAPSAYLLEVPAADFDFGEELSAVAAAGVASAIRLLDRFISGVHPAGAAAATVRGVPVHRPHRLRSG